MRIVAERRLVEYAEGWETIFSGLLVDFINDQPGETLHAVALFEGGRVGYYTQY